MITMLNWRGRFALMLAHCAGMVDLVALPVWVGAALIGQYGFTPPEAGGIVTAYLVAAVLASLVFAPRFNKHRPHRLAPLGFGIATLAFAALTQANSGAAMAALHAVAGFGAGIGLSFTHGTIGRSGAPHRLFALVNLALGVLAIVFLGAAQSLIPKQGGAMLFVMFAALTALATIATAVAFPRLETGLAEHRTADATPRAMAAPVWWVIAGITLMAVCQAMLFSFVERIGADRGFGDRVILVLIALGFVNLFPPVVAALLEKRLDALRVGAAGAAVQAALALTVTFSSSFAPYALAAAVYVAVMIFTHTFVFGWLSGFDASGRAVALTPAMLMSGAAIGPLAGGVLMAAFGTAGLGAAVLVVDLLAIGCFARAAALVAALAATPRTAMPDAIRASRS